MVPRLEGHFGQTKGVVVQLNIQVFHILVICFFILDIIRCFQRSRDTGCSLMLPFHSGSLAKSATKLILRGGVS